MNKSSYTAASTLPIKVIINSEICKQVKNHNIKPIHIQINPTNKCPLSCSFCSLSNRDKTKEMDLRELIDMTMKFKQLGTQAITITGGGEPLAYYGINEYINFCHNQGIKLGLVSNGVLIHNLDTNVIKKFTWIRISLSDEYKLLTDKLKTVISNTINDTDWSFSYVITHKLNMENIIKAINFGNQVGLKHIRIVDDILSNEPSKMREIKNTIKSRNINDDIVIYQGRKSYRKGNKKCMIGLLKPNIDAEGYIYSCCGIQYITKTPSRDFKKELSIGHINDIDRVWDNQIIFDGSVCDRCYYDSYNELLNMCWDHDDIQHKEFL